MLVMEVDLFFRSSSDEERELSHVLLFSGRSLDPDSSFSVLTSAGVRFPFPAARRGLDTKATPFSLLETRRPRPVLLSLEDGRSFFFFLSRGRSLLGLFVPGGICLFP